MLFVDIDVTFHLFRVLFHIVLAAFFFAIWQGPGQKRLTWLLWTVAFIIDTVQVALNLCTTTLCTGELAVWVQFGLSLLWLWVIITASYMWRPGNGDGGVRRWPYVFGTAWMLIMIAAYALGVQFGTLALSVYMLGVMLFLGHIYARVGGVLLGVVGMWSGGGDSLAKSVAQMTGIDVTAKGAIILNMSVELASLILFLTILYLYLSRLCHEREAYEKELQARNRMQKQAISIATELAEMGNVAAREDLHGTIARCSRGVGTAGEYI